MRLRSACARIGLTLLLVAIFVIGGAAVPAVSAQAACADPGETSSAEKDGDEAIDKDGDEANDRESLARPKHRVRPDHWVRRDAKWPVVSTSSESSVDSATGRLITKTVVVREDPSPPRRISSVPRGLTLGPQVALAAFSCILTTNASYQVDISMGGVFDQHYLLLLNRWFAGNYPVANQWVYAYANYETDVWWTRSDTAYDLSAQKNTWAFGNYDCNQVFNPQSTNSTAWLPSWASSSSTYTYIYYGPMSTWPVLWAGLAVGGVMHTDQWTDVTQSGSFVGRISGSLDLPKN